MEKPFDSRTQSTQVLCSSPHKKQKAPNGAMFLCVDLIVESWNSIYSWIFDASEAITERGRLENNLISV